MKKVISLLLAVLMAGGCVMAGCTNDSTGDSSNDEKPKVADPAADIKVNASTDKYRNFYEIFTGSFCDSNGDQTGDLQGIISQLDYLNDGDPETGHDLGIDGIWLTPIMPSKSYHKYDVENYYDIDPDFGTLEDFDQLVTECHSRGIKLIMDLVLNHISSQNPLYTKAVEEVAEGKLDGNAEYFEIHKADYFGGDTVYNTLANGYACEANFSPDMPEWDLTSKKTREEFKKIAKFWLDRGVDGFRLDACKFYDNKSTDGVEFLKWFYTTCQEINPDVYMVGEHWVDSDNEMKKLYGSGIDSLFAFKFATTNGRIFQGLTNQNAKSVINKVKKFEDKMKEGNPNEINAMFLSNHDQSRMMGALGSKGLSYEKIAAATYMLFPGNPFIYYGEEIGMSNAESDQDAAYRTAMIFDSENLPNIFIDSIGEETTAPRNGGVKQQLEDKNSLLNYYRRIIKIKNQNPELARGEITDVFDLDDSAIGAFCTQYEETKLLVIHNFDPENAKDITITDDMLKNPVIRGDLVAEDIDSHIELKDGKLTLPAHSTVILKQG